MSGSRLVVTHAVQSDMHSSLCEVVILSSTQSNVDEGERQEVPPPPMCLGQCINAPSSSPSASNDNDEETATAWI